MTGFTVTVGGERPRRGTLSATGVPLVPPAFDPDEREALATAIQTLLVEEFDVYADSVSVRFHDPSTDGGEEVTEP